jgi:natural product precursor
MFNSTLEKFSEFKMESSELKHVKGGLCGCREAAPYACQAAGYDPGTGGFANCMGDVYADCDALGLCPP